MPTGVIAVERAKSRSSEGLGLAIANAGLTGKAGAKQRRQDMALTDASTRATGYEQRKRGLTPEGLIKTEVSLRESVDGMTQAVSDFEKLTQLAASLAHEMDAGARLSPNR
jgi:hypothetical protein